MAFSRRFAIRGAEYFVGYFSGPAGALRLRFGERGHRPLPPLRGYAGAERCVPIVRAQRAVLRHAHHRAGLAAGHLFVLHAPDAHRHVAAHRKRPEEPDLPALPVAAAQLLPPQQHRRPHVAHLGRREPGADVPRAGHHVLPAARAAVPAHRAAHAHGEREADALHAAAAAGAVGQYFLCQQLD